MGKSTSVYLPDDVAEAVKAAQAAGITMTELLRRGLGARNLTIREAAREAAEAVRDDVQEIVRAEVRRALGELRGGGGW